LALAMMEYLLVGPRLVEWLIALPEPGP
jgi:hypothetical protein